MGAGKKLDPKVAEAAMLKAGLKPLEPYINSGTKWKCKCLKCGDVVFPRYDTIKSGQGGCIPCGILKMKSKQRLPEEKAVQIMRMAGFQPLEPFNNSNQPWKCKCLKCGQIVTPTLGNIKQGFSGRKMCCGEKGVTNIKDAKILFRKAGFIMLELYENSAQIIDVKCVNCGELSTKTLQSIKAGQKCIWCAGHRKDPKKLIDIMLKYDLEPLEPYKGANEPWKCKCLRTGKTVSPSFSSIRRRKKHVCKFCGQNFVDPKKAIKFMISKGYKPQVPYTTVHTNWESIHIPCGNIVSPQYAQIQQGFGGCRHCAEWGFQYDKKSYLYLITNPMLNAHKVGIANIAKRTKSDRLKRMQNDGWVIFKVWHFDEGQKVLNIEKAIFKILREEMSLPQYLSQGEMKHEGETETVDADSISLLQLEKIINKVIRGMKR